MTARHLLCFFVTGVALAKDVILLQGRYELRRPGPLLHATKLIDASSDQQDVKYAAVSNHSRHFDGRQASQAMKRRAKHGARREKGKAAAPRKIGGANRRRRRRSRAQVRGLAGSVGALPQQEQVPKPSVHFGKPLPAAASWLSSSASFSDQWPYSSTLPPISPTLTPLPNLTSEEWANITEFRRKASRDCEVSDWSHWSECQDDLPEDGLKAWVRKRKRKIVTPPRKGGKTCPGLIMRSLCKFKFKIFGGETEYEHELHGKWFPIPDVKNPLPRLKVIR